MQRYYSNVYWHFTGSRKGVEWHNVRKPSDLTDKGEPQPPSDAVETLKLILGSNKLKATCHERIDKELITEKFCCVTDIPIKDLQTHSPYYGKVAIGFRAAAIHKSFLPVLYIPKSNLPAIEKVGYDPELLSISNDLLASTGGWGQKQGLHLRQQAERTAKSETLVDSSEVTGFLKNFLKITEFSTNPEDTFYREREWRHIGDFGFEKTDVEAIVVPEEHLCAVRSFLVSEAYPDNISVISWEFIGGA